MASTKNLTRFFGTVIITAAIFLMGSGMRGEWLLILAHLKRHLQQSDEKENLESEDFFSLSQYKLQNVHYFCLYSFTFSYVMYFGMGCFLHWYYYIRQKDRAHEWKCQPTKWLSPELIRHEIVLGTLSLSMSTIISGILSCYIYNGGETMVYYDVRQHGWLWFCLQGPFTFFCQDYVVYWHHRIHHTPWLYKHFHKLHHTYKQPTPFSATAIHPFEILQMQVIYLSPTFLFPVHWLPFVCILTYVFYNGILDHSGINFKRRSWQIWGLDSIFHDNHHQYFHVNFGLNCKWWDKIHGTCRQKDRIYSEDIFYGKGKSLDEASQEEINRDMEETQMENPAAYRSNRNKFQLNDINYKKD